MTKPAVSGPHRARVTDLRKVSLFVRIHGVTKADCVDTSAFVGVVVEGARRHLGMREHFRVEVTEPRPETEAADNGEPPTKRG